jgi:S1-C subfamily serine protease
MIAKDDQIRTHVINNPGLFKRQEREQVDRLYPPVERFRELLEQDAERFRTAIEQCSVTLGQTEPISALVLRFEAELDIATAAAELGLKPDALLARLNGPGALSRRLGPLKVEGGTVKRETFINGFAEAVRELNLGTPLRVSTPLSFRNRDVRESRDQLGAKKPNELTLGASSAGSRSFQLKPPPPDKGNPIPAPDFVKCAERLRQSVIRITTDNSVGAGFPVGDGTIVVTCSRVIENAGHIEIETADGVRQDATLLLSMPSRGLAALQTGNRLEPLFLAREEQFMFLSPVMIFDIGNGREDIQKTGELTALFQARELSSKEGILDDTLVLTTDGPAAQAHVGAPLATPDGLVVGIMTDGNAALHAGHVKELVEKAAPRMKLPKGQLSSTESIRLERMQRTIALHQMKNKPKRSTRSSSQRQGLNNALDFFSGIMRSNSLR